MLEWQEALELAVLVLFSWIVSRDDWFAEIAFLFRWWQEYPRLAEYLAVWAILFGLMAATKTRSRAETLLAEQETWMELLAQEANFSVWIWHAEHKLIQVKSFGRDMHGLPADKLVDYQAFLAAIHPDDREFVQQSMQRALRQQIDYRAEYRLADPAGPICWVAAVGRGGTNTGRTSSLMGVSINITARKQAEQAAQEQQQMVLHMARVATLGELSGSLAHELNQPLAAILCNAQAGQRFLQQTPPDWQELRGILDDIVADDRRAGEVVGRLRMLLKKEPAVREKLNINALIQDVAKMLRRELTTKHTRLDLRLAEDLPAIHGDPVQIRQVLLNLLMNGAEATASVTAQARRLQVSSNMDETGTLQVAVQDNGPGIAPQRLEQIFQPFATSKPEGLGMGLSISHTIIAEHGGRLWASNAPEGGAVLNFTLPTIQENKP